jgi:pimeloyl-ACP methyl ester carboxylesterase
VASQITATSAARVTVVGAGHALAALDTGAPPVDGPTLLLLPGYTGSKEDFAPILDPLADSGTRAIALDLPGQFESPGPDDEGFYRPAGLGPVIADVIAALRAPVVVLGHSYGGLVARAAVVAGAPVAGLILLCSGPAAFTGGARLDALRIGGPLLREHGVAAAWALRQATTESLRGSDSEPTELIAFRERRFLGTSEVSLLGMAAALIDEPDTVEQTAAALVGRPVAVLAGEHDDAWPLDEQRDMARRLGTELGLIPGAAHSPAVENPDALTSVLVDLVRRWTDRNRPAPSSSTS